MGVSLAGLESVHKDIREPRCVISISFQKNSEHPPRPSLCNSVTILKRPRNVNPTPSKPLPQQAPPTSTYITQTNNTKPSRQLVTQHIATTPSSGAVGSLERPHCDHVRTSPGADSTDPATASQQDVSGTPAGGKMSLPTDSGVDATKNVRGLWASD